MGISSNSLDRSQFRGRSIFRPASSRRPDASPTTVRLTGHAAMRPRGVADVWPSTEAMAPVPRDAVFHPCADRQFLAMRDAYRRSGGLARGEDLARLLEDHRRGDFVSLAKLIAAGEVLAFEWRDAHWIPMFQFNLGDLSIKPAPRRVLGELAKTFDGWSLAVWFVEPNSWLSHRRPVDLMEAELSAVLEAARADRFIATG